MPLISWAEALLDPLEIQLDAQNPRIEVSVDASQEEIRKQLILHEKVLELANEINQAGRLLPGESIIICLNDGKYVVLEGNRRVCACQMLLDRSLIPPEYEKRFPEADNPETFRNISLIRADVAPSRDAAEHVLTKRHTQPGIKKWSPIAKMRRVSRWLKQGKTIEEISNKLAETKTSIAKSVRNYNLFEVIIRLPYWAEDELNHLKDEALAINPFTRFFDFSETREFLAMSFDKEWVPVFNLGKNVYEKALYFIAKGYLIDDPAKERPRFNTRTSLDVIFLECQKYLAQCGIDMETQKTRFEFGAEREAETGPDGGEKPDLDSEPKAESGKNDDKTTGDNGGKTGEQLESGPSTLSGQGSPRTAMFFENLKCSIQDDRCVKLTREIRTIKHYQTPIAATMLTRAILESALVYQLKKRKRWDELVVACKGFEPGLDKIIGFCIQKGKDMFSVKRARDVLIAFSGSGYKTVFDMVVHGDWADADTKTLEQSAALLRRFISYILNDEYWQE